MDSVLITAHSRPEYLHLCLEHVVKNPDYNKYHYIINLDQGFRRGNLSVINSFKPQFNHLEVRKVNNPIKGTCKQSYAVLEGYRYAQSKSDGLVFMLEEDVLVSNAFFQWHEKIHQLEPDIYCSIGTRNNNTRVAPLNDYGKYYLQKGDYQSLGVCFKRDLLNLVLAHANNDYYGNPFIYCKRHWPESTIGQEYVEQDGLHRRIATAHDLPVAFSFDGLAFHGGFYGYHRNVGRVTGTLEEKIAKIRRVAFDPQLLRKRVQEYGWPEEYYLDSEPVNLNITLPKELTCL